MEAFKPKCVCSCFSLCCYIRIYVYITILPLKYIRRVSHGRNDPSSSILTLWQLEQRQLSAKPFFYPLDTYTRAPSSARGNFRCSPSTLMRARAKELYSTLALLQGFSYILPLGQNTLDSSFFPFCSLANNRDSSLIFFTFIAALNFGFAIYIFALQRCEFFFLKVMVYGERQRCFFKGKILLGLMISSCEFAYRHLIQLK